MILKVFRYLVYWEFHPPRIQIRHLFVQGLQIATFYNRGLKKCELSDIFKFTDFLVTPRKRKTALFSRYFYIT